MNANYPTRFQANYTLTMMMVAYVFSFVDRQILSLLVGPIKAAFSISDFELSLLQGMAFALFYVMLGIPIGRLADNKNRKNIITIGVVLWSFMTTACGLAQTYTMLFLTRIGVGVGEATLSPAAYSILSDSYPPRRLALALAIFTLGGTIGSGAAFIIGGSVIHLLAQFDHVTLPIVGTIKPWQLAFIVVGAPGILIGLIMTTITEPIRQGGDALSELRIPLKDVIAFILKRWRSYGSIFGSISLLSILGYGFLNWYPTFLIRTYGLPAQAAGVEFGIVYLVSGIAGAFGGAFTSEYLAKRGYRDANPRTIVLVSTALTFPGIAAPLMPNVTLALVAAAPAIFFLNAFFGVSIAALQIVTPNRMRATVSAVFLFMTTFTGLGLGSSIVAYITDFVFQNELALRYSLATTAAFVCPLAAIVAGAGLKHYRLALDGTDHS